MFNIHDPYTAFLVGCMFGTTFMTIAAYIIHDQVYNRPR